MNRNASVLYAAPECRKVMEMFWIPVMWIMVLMSEIQEDSRSQD